MLARELTASTNSSAGWSTAFMAARTPATSLVTPVAVSLWVTRTALIWCARSASRMRAELLDRGALAPVASTSIDLEAEPLRHMSIHRCENWPMRAASTRSPGESVLVSPASQPPVPEPGKMNTSALSDLNTFFRSANSGSVREGKSGRAHVLHAEIDRPPYRLWDVGRAGYEQAGMMAHRLAPC